MCSLSYALNSESRESVQIISNYSVLQLNFEEVKELITDTEIKSTIIGVTAQMQNVEFYFGVALAAFLKHSDHLSCTLQHTNMSAAEGQEVASLDRSSIIEI